MEARLWLKAADFRVIFGRLRHAILTQSSSISAPDRAFTAPRTQLVLQDFVAVRRVRDKRDALQVSSERADETGRLLPLRIGVGLTNEADVERLSEDNRPTPRNLPKIQRTTTGFFKYDLQNPAMCTCGRDCPPYASAGAVQEIGDCSASCAADLQSLTKRNNCSCIHLVTA